MSPEGSIVAWSGCAAVLLGPSLQALGRTAWLGAVLLKTCILEVVLVPYL